MKLSVFEEIENNLVNLEKELKNITLLEFGQKILENNEDFSDNLHEGTKEYTLDEMKK
jgi:hypothetical protein